MNKITKVLVVNLLDEDLVKHLEKQRKELEMQKSDFIRYLLKIASKYEKK